MKKIAVSLLLILVASAIIQALPVQAVTPEENAINLGLVWLAKQQDTTTGAWSLSYYPVASTAFAVIKFAEYKYTTGDTTYDSNVRAGLKYILSYGSSFQFNITADLIANPGHWTGPPGALNGIGIYFRSTVGTTDTIGVHSATYETGIVMMAFWAADQGGFINRNALVPAGSDSAIVGRTYYSVMEDMMKYYAWAQNDVSSGNARGGWRYYPNTEDPNNWGKYSDNSVSQWPVLGLISAEVWGIYAPNWVKSELLNYWLAYSQNYPGNGGFGYSGPGSPTVAMTAAGLIELTYCGVPKTDPRWTAAENYIGNNWASSNIGNMYCMYGVMKAAMTATPPVTDFGSHNWQAEYDNNLVAAQVKSDGYGYWPGNGDRDTSPTDILTTEWALLILEKVVPPVGGISVPVAGLALSTSYISLVSIFAIATVATAICTKRVKRGKEKQ